MGNKKQLMALALCGLVGAVQAGEKEELLKLRNTTTNLIKELVKQGILTEKVAEEMIKKAETDAQDQVEQQGSKKDIAAEEGEVRVPYVPEFVKDEIRQQVRSELRKDVVSDVMQEAKTQKWGVPDALPEWINRFKISGDLRLRSQNDFYGDDNAESSYFDWQTINNRGGISNAGLDAFLNTTNDRHRFRERLRLSIDAKVTEGLKAGVRIATGNMPDPVSTNQTMGNTGSQYEFNLDRAYLKYDLVNDEGYKWLTLSGGRIASPWYVGGGEFTGGSELVWDTDLSFEGFAATVRHRLGGSDSFDEMSDDSHFVYATAGAFPLQESAFSSENKWLFGGQAGLDWGFENQDALKLAVAYFDYKNVTADPNNSETRTCDTNTRDNTFSIPQFMQGGNTVSEICLEGTREVPGTLPGAVGLASDYNILNINGSYDFARFAPYHVILGADFAKNLGYDKQEIFQRTGQNIAEKTNAWQVRVDFGWPKVERAGQWNLFSAYKYVERDAILDAYTDSDFHLGGTDAKGWFVGGNYGLMKNVWFTGRWLSADAISGPTYGVDLLQLDVNTRF